MDFSLQALVVNAPNVFISVFCFKLLASTLVIAAAITYRFFRSKHVYLIDSVCYRPPEMYRVPTATFLEHIERWDKYDAENIEFLTKVLERSGIGSESYFPPGIQHLPNDQTFDATLEEVEMVLYSVAGKLFEKHAIDPNTIDIVITNCSVVCPIPSLASMVIHKFGLRSDVRSFNLSGMGCSAGLISVSLAKDLLSIHGDSLALILSTESVCSNIYHGKVKSMLLANCLFRMGGAAVLLSNKKADAEVAKYELRHLVRTHVGAEDRYYRCVIQEPDEEGITGVRLSKSLRQLAGEALKVNVASLAVLVLPYSEQVKYALEVMWRKKRSYVPNFRTAFEHFCIHSGGKAVIETVKDRLGLSECSVEASRMTLHKFGNTSSASTWYALSYLEAKGRVKKGDRIWQLGFGSGLKCNSAVWKCLRKIDSGKYNVWSDLIHNYPVHVPELMDH